MAAQVLADNPFDIGGLGDDAIEVPVGLYPFGRGFWPHLGHTRNVVGGVANQRQIIGDAIRRNPELSFYTSDVEPLVAHGVDQRHLRCHQLGQIFVARRDNH